MPSLSTSLWLTPLILLTGVAMLVLSTSNRLNRLHDEVHNLLHRVSRVALDHLRRRIGLFHRALVSLYVCIGLFALAGLLGMLGEVQDLGLQVGRDGQRCERNRYLFNSTSCVEPLFYSFADIYEPSESYAHSGFQRRRNL